MQQVNNQVTEVIRPGLFETLTLHLELRRQAPTQQWNEADLVFVSSPDHNLCVQSCWSRLSLLSCQYREVFWNLFLSFLPQKMQLTSGTLRCLKFAALPRLLSLL